jgi:hypothetical protein
MTGSACPRRRTARRGTPLAIGEDCSSPRRSSYFIDCCDAHSASGLGQPRQSDETSRMSALPLIAAEHCTAVAGTTGHFRTLAAQQSVRHAPAGATPLSIDIRRACRSHQSRCRGQSGSARPRRCNACPPAVKPKEALGLKSRQSVRRLASCNNDGSRRSVHHYPSGPVLPKWPVLSLQPGRFLPQYHIIWGPRGNMEDAAMRPRATVLPDLVLAPKRRGLASRFAGATVFFFVGAITATELYPQMVENRRFEGNRSWESQQTAARSTTPDVFSDRTAVFLHDSALNTGGPIPPVTFTPAQPAPAAKDAQSTADEAASVAAEKPRRRVEAKVARTKASSPRRYGTYQQEQSYWATGRGWSPPGGPQFGFNFGPRQSQATQFDRRGQFAMWR